MIFWREKFNQFYLIKKNAGDEGELGMYMWVFKGRLCCYVWRDVDLMGIEVVALKLRDFKLIKLL